MHYIRSCVIDTPKNNEFGPHKEKTNQINDEVLRLWRTGREIGFTRTGDKDDIVKQIEDMRSVIG